MTQRRFFWDVAAPIGQVDQEYGILGGGGGTCAYGVYIVATPPPPREPPLGLSPTTKLSVPQPSSVGDLETIKEVVGLTNFQEIAPNPAFAIALANATFRITKEEPTLDTPQKRQPQ